jgi:hypothetical protein
MASSTRFNGAVSGWIGALAVVALTGSPGRAATLPGDLPYTIARTGCTAEDIPGIEIVFTASLWNGSGIPPSPSIRIEAAGLTPGTPITIALSPLRRDPTQRVLARAVFQAKQAAPLWLSGTVRLDQVVPDQRVQGHYDVCLPGGGCASADFQAEWQPGQARCG